MMKHRDDPLFWSLQLAGWSAYAVALMVPWLGRYPLSIMWSNKVVIAGTGLLVSWVLRFAYRRVARGGLSLPAIAVLVVVLSVVAAFVWNAIASTLLGQSLQHDSALLGALGRTWPRFDGALYHALVLVTWSSLYLGGKHYRALVAERERSLRAESVAREVRLQALRYQIGPHFLFNALNAVSTLVVTDRKADATATIARLAHVLRVSLESPATGVVALRDELAIVEAYVSIERVRFGDRLRVEIDAHRDVLDIRVPPMLLQPLVENAIRHAVAQRDEPTTITIRAFADDSDVVLVVSDDGSPVAMTADGFGIGLANIRARLDALYPDAHAFDARAAPEGGFRVAITIPRSVEAMPDAPLGVLEAELA